MTSQRIRTIVLSVVIAVFLSPATFVHGQEVRPTAKPAVTAPPPATFGPANIATLTPENTVPVKAPTLTAEQRLGVENSLLRLNILQMQLSAQIRAVETLYPGYQLNLDSLTLVPITVTIPTAPDGAGTKPVKK